MVQRDLWYVFPAFQFETNNGHDVWWKGVLCVWIWRGMYDIQELNYWTTFATVNPRVFGLRAHDFKH